MKEIIVTIDDDRVAVKKIPLRKLASLLGSLENLPKILDITKGKSGEDLMKMIPELVNQCWPDLVRIITSSTDQSEEALDEWSIGNLVKVAWAIYEVNEIEIILEKVKKLGAQRSEAKKEPSSMQTAGSTA